MNINIKNTLHIGHVAALIPGNTLRGSSKCPYFCKKVSLF
jgi:hypothetical protein